MTYDELQELIKNNMRSKSKINLSILRQVLNEVKNIEINERREITEADVNAMIKRVTKQTTETYEASLKAGTNPDRTETLRQQLVCLSTLLPPQLDGDDLAATIDSLVSSLGLTSKKDTGKLMKALTAETDGNFNKQAAISYFNSLF